MSQSPPPARIPVVLPGSVQFEMTSRITGRTYRIYVSKPDVAPPSSGYPVVVGTDGNMVFPLMATVNATFALTGKVAIVVCVGYPTDETAKLFSLRCRDLTPPTPMSGLPNRPGLPTPNPADYGGAEEFYRFLIEELRPAIAAAYPVDATDYTLYGHSLAGLFTLAALFDHPDSFRNFVASSPAIWWNDRSLLEKVPAFVARIRAKNVGPRVLIMVGSSEQAVPKPLPPSVTDAVKKKMSKVPAWLRDIIARVAMKKMMVGWRMVDNARELAERLQHIRGAGEYAVRFHEFEEQDHLTALPASIGHGLAFVLRR